MDELGSLSIIKLSEPLLLIAENEGHHEAGRMSDASSTTLQADIPTPASLQADLTHYKVCSTHLLIWKHTDLQQELFTKLRFSYVEQVTKERFLRAVVGDPPLYVSASQNSALESQLLSVKATLKAQKTEVSELIAELERQGRALSQKHQHVQLQTIQLTELPEQIADLKSTIETLKAAQEPKSDNPLLILSLPQTMDMLSETEEESMKLDMELAELQAAIQIRARELSQLQSELAPLQVLRGRAVADAEDSKKRKAQGISGLGDELEERGRWLKGVETTLKGMLEAGA